MADSACVDLNSVLSEGPKGISIHCRVQPRSSRNALLGIHDHALKIALTAPPVDGQANRELCRFLSDLLGISRSSVTVQSGANSRNKRVCVPAHERARILARLSAAIHS